MGAWGGWALAPYTADGEGLPLPHRLVVASCRTFKTADDFFNPVLAGRWQENPGIAGYLAAFTADFSDAIDGGASFSVKAGVSIGLVLHFSHGVLVLNMVALALLAATAFVLSRPKLAN